MRNIVLFIIAIAIISCGEQENKLNYTYKEYRDDPAIAKEVKGNYSADEIEGMEKIKAENFLADNGKEFLARSVHDIIEEYREMKKNLAEYESSITSLDEVLVELEELKINSGSDPYMVWTVEAENSGGELITGFSMSMLLINEKGDTLREDIARFKKELAPGEKKTCKSEQIQLFKTRELDQYVIDNGSDAVFAATKARMFSIKLPTKQTEFKVEQEDIDDIEMEEYEVEN